MQDKFFLEIEVNLWRKKEKQLFSKIVRVSKLTKQRTLQINNSHLDMVAAVDSICKKKKTFPIHGELKKAIKSQRFFPKGAVI